MADEETGRADHQTGSGDRQTDHHQEASNALPDEASLQPQKPEIGKGNSAQRENDTENRTRPAIEWSTVFQGVLALAAVLVFGYTACDGSRQANDRAAQLLAVQNSNELTRAALEETRLSNQVQQAGQRAFVSLAGIAGTRVVINSRIAAMGFTLRFQNTGVTPGRSLLARSNVQIWPTIMTESFDFTGETYSPGGTSFVLPGRQATQELRLPIQDLIDAMTRSRHLYFWGWVGYRDVFPGTPARLTEFCVELVGITATAADLTAPSTDFRWTMIPCPIPHNCYDENCDDYQNRIEAYEQDTGLSPTG